MKLYCYILGLLLLCSCNYFENKKIYATDDLVQEKLRELDKASVDKYPVFKSCETENSDKTTEKECFVTTLSQYITRSLSAQNLILDDELDVSFQVIIQVTNEGEVAVLELLHMQDLYQKIPNIEELVKQSIKKLPEIMPAYKQTKSGDFIAVNTKFKIPVRVLGKLTNEDELVQ
ncbi:MAG: hypothetical protein ACPGU9_02560 [Flavobacteriaceae bacterium]